MCGGFLYKGFGYVELAFAEEMHGYSAVYEGGVGGEGVIFGGGERLVFEFLDTIISMVQRRGACEEREANLVQGFAVLAQLLVDNL